MIMMSLFNIVVILYYYLMFQAFFFFFKQTRNKIKIKRKYRIGGHEPDPVNLNETTLKVKRQNSKHQLPRTIQHTHVWTRNRIAKKRRANV